MFKVEGKTHLVKDPITGSVVNTDENAFRQAKAAKRRILESRKKEQELEERVNKLESALELLLKEKEHG